MTPSIAIVHVHNADWRGHGFKLWVPLFLFWIPVILLSPLILLVVFAVSIARRIDPIYALRVFWDITCSLPGTDVRVTADGNKVLVRIL